MLASHPSLSVGSILNMDKISMAALVEIEVAKDQVVLFGALDHTLVTLTCVLLRCIAVSLVLMAGSSGLTSHLDPATHTVVPRRTGLPQEITAITQDPCCSINSNNECLSSMKNHPFHSRHI